ncbi:MAG: VCBS repeat-containing protein [Bryobacteraceae bacterium]
MFEDYTIRSGLARLTNQLTGWSMGLFDFDNDGWKDLFFANSNFPQLNRYLGTLSELSNSVFRNLGNGRFGDGAATAGEDFQAKALYRGAAFADFDNDGKIDVVVTALNGPAKLFRNTTTASGHWLGVKLVGSESNRDGLGTDLRTRRTATSSIITDHQCRLCFLQRENSALRLAQAGNHYRAALAERSAATPKDAAADRIGSAERPLVIELHRDL